MILACPKIIYNYYYILYTYLITIKSKIQRTHNSNAVVVRKAIRNIVKLVTKNSLTVNKTPALEKSP